MLGSRTLRDRSSSRDPDASQQIERKSNAKEKVKKEVAKESWSEPSLAQNPSYRDHKGGSYYGVSEHMQPLGEAPNAKVKTRVKPDGGRKSMLGKGAGVMGLDATDTPEGTPAPPEVQREPPAQPRIVVEDEDDGEYAPKVNGKKKERAARPRGVRPTTEATSYPTKASAAPPKPPANINKNKIYDAVKLKSVVESAKKRAIDVGKPDLAAAVNAVYERSLYDARLTELLEGILSQSSSEEQTREFQEYVKIEKRRLRELKEKSTAKDSPRNAPETTKPTNGGQSLPVRSPSKFTSTETKPSAKPSSARLEPPKLKASRKSESPAKDSGRRRSHHSNRMSRSPSKKRSGSVGSDSSSLSELTSNPDDEMDVDEPGDAAELPTTNGVKTKDHAAERGSLAAPNRNLKRSSAEAELQEDERDRDLAKKKQKLNETVNRDYPHQESNMRGPPSGENSRLRSQRGKDGNLAPPTLSSAKATRNASARGSRAVSTDLDSPLSSPASSRRSTPQVSRVSTKPFIKRAETKQS